jgi:hypothetical protein
VSLDIGVRALIELGCSDREIAETFNFGEDAGVKQMRRRGKPNFVVRPAPPGEHRFLRKGTEWLQRFR